MKYFKSKKKLLLLGTAIILIAGALVYIFFIKSDAKSQQETQDRDTINYNPPTKEDKEDVEENKQEIAEDQEKDPEPGTDQGTGSFAPIITYIGQYEQVIEASGQVTGVFEDGGTCTLELTQGNLKVSKSSKGFKDYNHVTCTAFSIPRSEFAAAGTWTAILSYKSASGTGVSQPRTVEVQ